MMTISRGDSGEGFEEEMMEGDVPSDDGGGYYQNYESKDILGSWQQMADYDLPATVDFILQKTGYTQLSYVGHSQGTLIAFAKFSEDLVFAKKIKTFFALAPVATVGHLTAPIGDVAPYVNAIYAIADELLDITQMDQLFWLKTYIKRYACDDSNDEWAVKLCNNMMINAFGPTYGEMWNKTNIPVFLSHNPAGESIQDVVHFGQMVNSKQMQKFDYGFVQNEFHYGQPTPPLYDVGRMEVETVLFWSKNDSYADPVDVGLLIPQLKHQTNTEITGFTHFDFIYALKATELVYDPIIKKLDAKRTSNVA